MLPKLMRLCFLATSIMSSLAFADATAKASTVEAGAAHESAAESGLTEAQKQAIDRYVDAEIARQHIPGATVGIYRRGKMVYGQGYGYANIEWQIRMRPDTLLQSGSVGKQFVATAVMMLVEQGKVGLEDSIRKVFPEGPESWEGIKIKNLLSHSSGLAEYESDERTKPGALFDLRADFSEDQLVKNAAAMPIESGPGEKFAYRNTNFMLLGVLIHRVTGQFYGDYLQDHIFRPLGMSSTRIISDRDIVPNRAAGYEVEGAGVKNQKFVSATFNSTGDGALYFNLPDLEKWDRAQYGDGILTPAMKEKMWTPFLLNDGKPNPANYGFAFFIGKVNDHRVIEHGGAWQGFTTIVSRYIDDGLSVVVLTNLDAGHANPGIIDRVVAGMVEPALMPVSSKAIADDRPELAATARNLLVDIADGRDATRYFAPGSPYKFEAGDAAELNFSLPPEWRSAPMELINRKLVGDLTESRYRIGPIGNRRLFSMRTTADGKMNAYRIGADPDNR